MTHVGIDGSCWSNRRGFGRFTRCLVTEMAELAKADRGLRLTMVMDSPSLADPALPPIPAGIEVLAVPVKEAPSLAAAADGSRRPADLLRLGLAASRARFDVLFFPASYSYFPVMGVPTVVTVHDAIAEQLTPLVLPTRSARLKWKAKQSMALRQAALVLTVSAASASAIGDALKVAPDRIEVIREAAAPIFRPLCADERAERLERLGIGPHDRFVLYVGGISPHKNLAVLIDAFELLAPEVADLELYLVGDADDDPFLSSADDIRHRIATSPFGERIHLPGFVSDDELVALYGSASATVLPSLGEGFGLPAAESAACGTPIVVSQDPALRELLGAAGRYADASSGASFAAELMPLVTDPVAREAAAAAVLELAATWSWPQAATSVIAMLEREAVARG